MDMQMDMDMDMHKLRDQQQYYEFSDAISAISHLILCEKCRNSQTGHTLFVQRLAMSEDRFVCGVPDDEIPDHLEDCEEEDCERCVECQRYSNVDFDDIGDQLIRFMETHTGLMANIVIPEGCSDADDECGSDADALEMEANFKSEDMGEIVPLYRPGFEPLSAEERNAIERYDSLRFAIFSVLHSVYCIGCYKHIDQVSEMLKTGQFRCKQKIDFPNHLAQCAVPLCRRCERAALVSDKTLTANQICDRFIRFVEIFAGVPPEKRMKAPRGRPLLPKAAASFKVVENVETEEENAESPVEAEAAETPIGNVTEAEAPANLVVEPKVNVANLGSGAVKAEATKTLIGNVAEVPANQMVNLEAEPTEWLSKSILIVLLMISLFIHFLSLKCKAVDSTGH